MKHTPEYMRAWKLAHPERIAEYQRRRNEKHPGAAAARMRAWVQKNPERKKEADRRRAITHSAEAVARARAWEKAHPAVAAAKAARRRAVKLLATPAWANGFFIEEIYDLCAKRTAATGFQWHVDHQVPLKSKTVCGLHVEFNLCVIPAKKNISKGNRTWPDMPEQERRAA